MMYERVREGLCPKNPDHGRLDIRDECGWCAFCDLGWSVENNKVRMHVESLNGGRLIRASALLEEDLNTDVRFEVTALN